MNSILQKVCVLLLLVSALPSISQSSLEIGDIWYHNAFDEFGPFINYSTIEIVGDTIINGQPCHIIEGDCNCQNGAYKFIYEADNKVHWYDGQLDSFHLLYDYDKGVGESWDVYVGLNFGSVTVTVDSIGKPIVNGVELPVEVQFISYENLFDFGEYIIPGIGSNACLFPQGNICDPQTGNLRCFIQASGELFTMNNEIACDSIIPLETSIEGYQWTDLNIYPNPASDFIQIDVNDFTTISKIELISVSGRIVYSKFIRNSTDLNLNLIDLSKGIYFLKIKGENQSTTSKIYKR